MKPTICVDFDGTICGHAFPDIGLPKVFVKEALEVFKKLGYHIIIYSCRTSNHHFEVFGGHPGDNVFERDRVKEMIAFLEEHEIPYDEIDDGTKGKPLADYYIDDKAIRFEDNWADIAGAVLLANIKEAAA